MLHGFGASANDLVPLAQAFPHVHKWYFPHAPFPIEVAGMAMGRAWFPGDMEQLTAALYGSYFQNLQMMEPPELLEAGELVQDLVETQLGFADTLVLGGFSQGAMVAAEYTRRAKLDGWKMPEALLLFSGALIAKRWWEQTAKELNASSGEDTVSPASNSAGEVEPIEQVACGPRVFQTHGVNDNILPYEQGVALRDWVRRIALTIEFLDFNGGHEIPALAINQAGMWLEEALAGKKT